MRPSTDRDDCVQAVHTESSLCRGQVPEDRGQRLVEEVVEPVKTEATAPLAAELQVPAPKDT